MEAAIAYKIAATAVEGVSAGQAKEIIDAFHLTLATCGACNNSLEGRCHDCGSRDGRVLGANEAWECAIHASLERCQKVCLGEEEAPDGENHDKCGPAVTIEIDKDAFFEGIG